MLDLIESPKVADGQSGQRSANGSLAQDTFERSTATICNVAGADAFCESYGKPHLPVSVAFGAEALHVCRLNGSWDLERAVMKNSEALVRSIRKLLSKNTVAEWDDLTFRFGPRAFLYADKDRLVGFASTAAEAESLVTRFSKTCRKPARPSGGTFYLIEQD